MNRRIATVMVAILSLYLVPLSSAGTQGAPEVTDPMGDQTIEDDTPGGFEQISGNVNEYPFDEVDLLAGWMTDNGSHLQIHVETNASISGADTNTLLEASFLVEKGPTSVFGSTANGVQWTLVTDSNFTTGGADNLSVTYDGVITTFHVPLADLGASGGDLITNLRLQTVASHPVQAPADPFVGTQSPFTVQEVYDNLTTLKATDIAPNNGTADNYTLSRFPIVPAVALRVEGEAHRVTADPEHAAAFIVNITNTGTDVDGFNLTLTSPAAGVNADLQPMRFMLDPGQTGRAFLTVTLNGTAVGTNHSFAVSAISDRGATSSTAASLTLRAVVPGFELRTDDATHVTEDPNATVTFDLDITNTGSDADTFFLDTPTVTGAALVRVEPGIFELDPGASASATVTVELQDAADGDVSVRISGTSDNGATAATTLTVTVDRPFVIIPPKDDVRDPVLASPAWLVDLAEALGFDSVFGDWAELVLLGLILLLLILLIFLIILLIRPRWVDVEVDERKATGRPGSQAEFHVTIDNRKSRHRRVKARLTGAEPGWLTQLQLHQEGADGDTHKVSDDGELEFDLAARNNVAGRLEGIVRVDIPDHAEDKDLTRLALDVVPLDDAGVERPKKGKTTNLTVQADTAIYGEPITLGEVMHDPAEPEEGQAVTTTATIENHSDEAWDLDIHLEVDGDLADQTALHVPPYSTATATFHWTADRGNNKVSVQVYPGS